MTETIRVDYQEGDLFEIAVRDHRLRVDQPIANGGTDSAPTPTELFVASLASCVAFYVRRFLARHALATEGLSVKAEFDMAARPNRVAEIRIGIEIPEGVPDERRAGLLAVASHCTVHNTLEQQPTVNIELTNKELVDTTSPSGALW
ncbi:MAG: OsmC family protein [Acidimicrobiales bacterium]